MLRWRDEAVPTDFRQVTLEVSKVCGLSLWEESQEMPRSVMLHHGRQLVGQLPSRTVPGSQHICLVRDPSILRSSLIRPDSQHLWWEYVLNLGCMLIISIEWWHSGVNHSILGKSKARLSSAGNVAHILSIPFWPPHQPILLRNFYLGHIMDTDITDFIP